MRTILIVGGGYAGFYTAWKLEKKLRLGEARVIVVDPRPYMIVVTAGAVTRTLAVLQFHRLVVKGFPAWLMHRGYHVLAVPTWERKVRVLAVWTTAVPFGRDIVSLTSVQHPRAAFLAGTRPVADALRS